MNIREATEKDIPEIVTVLKASLGEQELALSEEIWRYKHINNPFGKSLILVAEEEDIIVGVRAFMRWRWHNGHKEFYCFRAVDTATHPKHQGKGIFKKLTLKAIEIGKEEGADFVFNTPNEKSRPGYLKMGWELAGNIKVSIKPAFNSFWKIKKTIPDYEVQYRTSVSKIENLCSEWNSKFIGEVLYTPKSVEYLKWRYENNPLRQYEVLAASNYYIAGYIKHHKRIKELRIVECLYLNAFPNKEINKSIRDWSLKFGAQFISFSPELLKLKAPAVKGKFGPILTVRDLNLSPHEKEICSSIENWNYSLGDLELF
ncbi:GNAT family N-acetyltransferase [Zunongwangia sp. F260]|uniref:GNAT family N-acetyltransferase n=1 Tax=Autumnicola lenta TaxID=3075593 RepID=A0ABU3CHZ5_9FLAO|nr:GNAT family N-acetyltransferase [Zunongwangia sp. F260]MDT0645901.1 GNAT family N-acetyltransferase [Zunongwangia sp. F260]